MALSNIGRQLQNRADKETAKMGADMLGGSCLNQSMGVSETYHYYLGRADAIKWFLQQIDEIEGDKE